jgi:mono/diheme cytochrome c family protein
MMALKIAVFSIIALGLVFSSAFAADMAKGKALFNDPKLGGGTTGKSCNSCHKDGSGIYAAKKEFMGGKAKSLENAVNMCIEMMLKGKAIDAKSSDMANITAYIKTLKGKASGKAPGY